MAILSIDELKTLVENSQPPCVSLYMPTQKAGPETRQNPIRFKNLIREAEERLEVLGMRHTEVVDFLQSASELDTNDFWEHQNKGLVIFISANVFHYYRLPIELPELVVVSNQFHLNPLLNLVNYDGSFYLLALSQNNVKFFQGTRYSLNQLEVENLPQNLAETLLEDDIQKSGQHRITISRGSTASSAQHPGAFHGQGSPDLDKHAADILQFCYAVDEALHAKLRDEKAPLVLASVEYLFPLYKEANTYPHLLETGITGNPEIIKPAELHDHAWQIVEPLFHQDQESAIALYQQLAGEANSKAVNDIKEIVPAAYYQRIDSLFVTTGKQVWGKFTPENVTVDLHPEPEVNDEDMLDFAAIYTLLNGGRVYTLEQEEMPNGVAVAAICRY